MGNSSSQQLVYSTAYHAEKPLAFYWDTNQYKRVYDGLIESGKVKKEDFVEPPIAEDELLKKVHTEAYLDTLQQPDKLAEYLEVGAVTTLPGKVLNHNVVVPMRYAAGGTVLGAELAVQHGWAVNLGGGYHHASSAQGSGGCLINDISLAIVNIREKNPDITKILVVDLDAHQGNGYEKDKVDGIFEKYGADVKILDFYDPHIHPFNEGGGIGGIDYTVTLTEGIENAEYLQLLQEELPKALNETSPQLVIYLGGTSIHSDDPLGRCRVDADGIKERNRIVFDEIRVKRNIPIVMVTARGDNTANSTTLITESLLHLKETFNV